jgi:hypothetical protein
MRLYFKQTCILIIVLILPVAILAQDNTMYMLHDLPQANMLNPAVDFPCKYYLELPVVSSIKISYNNTSFSYKDFIKQGTGDKVDSMVMDFDNIYSKLGKHNAIYAEVENVLVGGGFHWKKYFISARIYQSHQAGIFYSKDLIGLKDGNWNSSTNSPVNYDLSRNEINAISYLGFSIGVSRQYTNELRIGARLSYLKGMINYNTTKSDLSITTTEQPLTVDVNAIFNSNLSFPMEYERDVSGRVYAVRPTTDNILGNYVFNKNGGMAVDLGIVYEISDKTKFSASLLNLGFIRWKSNSVNLNSKSIMSLNGFDLAQYTNNQGTDLIYLLRDTIAHSFRAFDSPTKYFTLLPMKIFAGATHEIAEKVKIGLVGKILVYNCATFPSITGTINVKPFSFIDLTGSVSYSNRSLRNIGFAAIIGSNRVNFYVASDMMPIKYVKETQSGIVFPYQSRSISLRLGLNVMFGCGGYKKPQLGPVCPAYN